MLEEAFALSEKPNLYIISPFTSVVDGIRKHIKDYCRSHARSKIKPNYMLDNDHKRIGTVHTFQGKEADEVIFLLGCDSSQEASGAIRWVNDNIVNVAVTRAKYRLYIIGDAVAWRKSPCVSLAKQIMDTYAIREIRRIQGENLPEDEKKKALIEMSKNLPSVTAFPTEEAEAEAAAMKAGATKMKATDIGTTAAEKVKTDTKEGATKAGTTEAGAAKAETFEAKPNNAAAIAADSNQMKSDPMNTNDSAKGDMEIEDVSPNTKDFIRELDKEFADFTLSDEQLAKFGFHNMQELNALQKDVRDNLFLGMKLYYLLEPVYEMNKQMDASCCAILFCKAMELQTRNCFAQSLKEVLPDCMVKGQGKGRRNIPLKDARDHELTLGSFCFIITGNKEALGERMERKGMNEYNAAWWKDFGDKLHKCATLRNNCCHSGLFDWTKQSYLLAYMFRKYNEDPNVNLRGLMFESQVGKKLV